MSRDGRRSVVLVTVDSLRADRCGHLGGRGVTPALDDLAAEGLAFERAVAPGPSTYESMPAVVTGRHMVEYPAAGPEDEQSRRTRLIRQNVRRETVAERFARDGYATGAFTTNPYTAGHTGFARGFDRYEDFMGGGEGPLMRRAAHVPVLSEAKHLVTLVRGDRASKPWEAYVDDVLAWADGTRDPYFLWVFLLDPHTPYLPPARHRPGSRAGTYYHNWRLWAARKWGLDVRPDAERLAALYDGAVRYADEFLDRLRGSLPGDPVVAVHSDHGEAFGEHGTYGHEPRLHEENVHVPLVISNAGATGRVAAPTSLTRLPALLRAAARGSLADAVPVDGDRDDAPTYAMARTLGPERLALRGRDWKYVARVDPPARRVRQGTLYDLAADPGETTDVSGEHPDAVAACLAVVRRRLAHERESVAVRRAAAEVDR